MPRSGIGGQETVAWGTHLCLFYKSTAELRQLLTLYFQAGLADGECCLWITGPSLSDGEALESLQRSIPLARDYLENGQLEILPHTQWYVDNGIFRPEAVLATWFSKLRQATQRGWAGLRVAGDASWLSSGEERQAFITYEQQVTETASAQRLLALCTYPSAAWVPEEMLQVMQCHTSVLLQGSAGWKSVDVSCF
ncbi:MAG: MEDS domain-containing protein [Nitrospira sp.]